MTGRCKRTLALTACLLLAVAAFSLAGCGSKASGTSNAPGQVSSDEPVERTAFMFDTVVTLSCYAPEELVDRAMERCGYFEERLSRTREGSDVWNINHARGARTSVAPETADLIARSLEFCEKSDGLFDITIGSATALWDFVGGVKPDDAELAEAVRHIDYRGVHVAGTEVWLDDPDAAIDLGGTAKGYIADDLAALLRAGGCTSGIINLGGNAYAIGSKPDGSPWSVGVQDPNGADQTVLAKIACTDATVVTSGLYERQFEKDGTLYYHILDPKTGYPVETDLVSSSVTCASSFDADCYATLLFLLGHDAALDLVNDTEGLEALLVDDKGRISLSDGAGFEIL